MTSHEEYQRIRDYADNVLTKWAQTGKNELAARYQTNKFMEACGANDTIIGGKEGIIEHRKLCCHILAIRCITLLTHEQLCKVDKLLERIAIDDAPMPKIRCGLVR